VTEVVDLLITVAFLVQSALLIWSSYALHRCSRTICKQVDQVILSDAAMVHGACRRRKGQHAVGLTSGPKPLRWGNRQCAVALDLGLGRL
jgi:hypothetical protein